MVGLVNEGLLDSTFWAYGSKDDVEGCIMTDVPEDGLTVAASYAGMELYYWAHGYSNLTEHDFLSTDVDFNSDFEIGTLEHVRPVHLMRSQP